MSDRERVQLNLRLDGQKELYEAVKAEATRQNTSVNSFVINALKAALGWETENQANQVVNPNVEAILDAVDSRLDEIIDKKVNERLERLGKLAA